MSTFPEIPVFTDFKGFREKACSYEYKKYIAKKFCDNLVCTKFCTGKGILGPVSLNCDEESRQAGKGL